MVLKKDRLVLVDWFGEIESSSWMGYLGKGHFMPGNEKKAPIFNVGVPDAQFHKKTKYTQHTDTNQ